MRIKCRGYEGNMIELDANEVYVRNPYTYEQIRAVPSYDISIRTDDGAKIELDGVKESEIEVIHG